MKNRKFWWALIVFLVAWSVWEMYPPTNQPLLKVFKDEAHHTDAKFDKIVADAQAAIAKDKNAKQDEFKLLREAVGTNDLQPYFPYYNVKAQKDPNYAILNRVQRQAAGKIKLGLDLQGGTQFLVSLDTNRLTHADTNTTAVAKDEERTRLISQATEVLRRRVDRLGVAEPVIQPAGANHILIQLPGLGQAEQDEATKNIQKAAYLEFRMVHPKSDELLKENIVEPGYEVLKLKVKAPDGTERFEPLLVEKRLANGLTGKFIKRAFPSREQYSNAPEIEFEFDSEGARRFGEFTRAHIGDRLAIVLDGELETAPVIQSAIEGGRGVITGQFDIAEAISIANVLENPLETPVHIDEVRQVDPTLGKDTVRSGLMAAILGTVFVAVFMIVYYHRCGLLATIAMIVNLIILLGVMCSIGTTLTLPGIAGIVLTVGMAVDANVLIYERLREEMATGKSLKGAIAAAYDRAFGTIFDSHSTTLISAIILIYMGTGPVKGFGVTLTIGVALSLFTALVVTRLIFDFLFARGWLNKIGMLHIIKAPHWDFMRWAVPAFATSWLIILIGMGWGIHRGHNVMGIDFAGGDAITMAFKQRVDAQDIRKTVEPIAGESQIQYQKGADQDTLQIVTPDGKSTAVEQALQKAFPDAGFHVVGRDHVGGTVGVEIQKSAVIAAFLSLFGILIYVAFRYEFSFSVGAVVAIVHDVLMTLGIFFISGRQLSAPMVAAVLTIIGFSINDTIVIFDRIREDLKLGVRGTFKEVINKALNQTLSRTIITSGTVFLATMALYLFGGGAINDFAFTFLVGIITGTYSSIYIASALVLWWHKGERPMPATTVSVGESAPDAREERVRAGA
jgi:SecD/SecF fusion protein